MTINLGTLQEAPLYEPTGTLQYGASVEAQVVFTAQYVLVLCLSIS